MLAIIAMMAVKNYIGADPTRLLEEQMNQVTRTVTGLGPVRCPGGCGFLVTWHETHCCGRCAQDSGHGERCDQLPFEEPDDDDEPEAVVRQCASEGCPYQVTWHATHCCGRCENGNGHGEMCARIPFEGYQILCPGGCGFQVTDVHDSHCCGKCESTDGTQHEGGCDKKQFVRTRNQWD